MARVSVIVPCYNGVRYLSAALQSAMDQSRVELEILVVDDGSTDGSADVVQNIAAQDGRVRLIEQQNAGVAAARNAGMRATSGDTSYVHFLDADDVLAPGALERLTSLLEADPTLVAAVGTCERIDSDGNLLVSAPDVLEVRHVDTDGSIRAVGPVERLGYWHLLPITPISTPGQCLIRRTSLPDGDVFDQSCAPCEDWDLWLRLGRSGEIGVVPGVVLQYRDHPASASKHHRLMQFQRSRVLDRQRAIVADDERSRLQSAWRFGEFGFDAQVCGRWAREHLLARNFRAAARYAVRAVRYRARFAWSVARRKPDVSKPTL